VPRLGAGTGGGERSHINRMPTRRREEKRRDSKKISLTGSLACIRRDSSGVHYSRARAMLAPRSRFPLPFVSSSIHTHTHALIFLSPARSRALAPPALVRRISAVKYHEKYVAPDLFAVEAAQPDVIARSPAFPAFFAIATFFVFCRKAKSTLDPRSDLPVREERRAGAGRFRRKQK